MNPSDQQIYNQALSLSSAGYKTRAHDLLVKLRHSNPNDANILVAMAYTCVNPDEARSILQEANQLAPNNPEVTRAQNWLAGQQTNQMQTNRPTNQMQQAQPVYMPASSSVTSSSVSRKSGPSKSLMIWIAVIAVALVAIVGFVIVSGTGVLDKDEAQSTLTTFMSAAAAGNEDGAAALVLPTMTKDQLKAAFLDPDAANLRDYSSLQINDSQFFSLPGGNSFIFKGVVTYKTLGKSRFEAQLQRVDEDEQWYVVSMQLSPPTK